MRPARRDDEGCVGGAGMLKVVSGGQTGVDRAALDVALALGMPCGGWCPRGRLAEDGAIADRYPLRETPSAEHAERTAWNVRDSDGTLVLTWGTPTGGTALTIDLARRGEKPCLVVNLEEGGDAARVRDWVSAHSVATLNVAGPRASSHPAVYEAALSFLTEALGDLGFVGEAPGRQGR